MCNRGHEIYIKRQGILKPLHGDDHKNRGWTQHQITIFHCKFACLLLIDSGVSFSSLASIIINV